MKTIQIALAALIMMFAVHTASAQDKVVPLAVLLKGTSVVAQDVKNTFLGKIDNEFGNDSILNEFSKYGNKFGADSIFNEFGKFGGKFSEFSPYNEFTNKPPMIVKEGKVIGYLTANKFMKGAISVPSLMSVMK